MSHDTNHEHKPQGRKSAIFWSALAAGIVIAGLGVAMLFARAENGRIAPGVSVGPLDVGGETIDDATQTIATVVNDYALTFSAGGESVTVPLSRPDNGNEKPIAYYDPEDLAARAAGIGRKGNAFTAALTRLRARIFGVTVPLTPTSLDRERLRERIVAFAEEKQSPAVSAGLELELLSDGSINATVREGENGFVYDTSKAFNDAEQRIRAFSAAHVELAKRSEKPLFNEKEVEPLLEGASSALARTPLTVKAKDQRWTLSRETIASWIDAVPDEEGRPKIGVSGEKAGKYLSARGEGIRIEPKNAVFEMENGKVTKFEPSENGEELDVDAAVRTIENALFGEAPADAIELSMRAIEPDITTAESNPYGIEEIVGIGESNFAGSPSNRRHNIRIGADSVNGTIIPPGEEFSLLEVLGTIDGTTGYLQELVIKGDKTTPEYGGGLCQIGSTAFRGALATGLVITERRNHSYRVPYYERDGAGNYIGPGKDATIYDPAPDFKFKNDMEHGVLILATIKGDRLTFTFWGKSDGRVAHQTDARVYNLVQPPPKKIIETTELPPGVEKCTERAHVGSDAVFTYTVKYANGEEKATDFFSRYRPWQEVCLRGVDPNAPVSEEADLPSADAQGAAGI